MPQLVGSNWGGLMFAALLFLITEFVLWKWGEMKTRWGRNTLIGFAIAGIGWTLLFLVAAVLTMYDDHQNLVGATVRIKHSLMDEVKTTRQTLGRQITDTNNSLAAKRLECARQEGQNDTLQKQNRDQQGSINGCLTQAIGLLKPVELKVTPVMFDSDNTNVAIRTMRWLVMINQARQPHLVIACSQGVTYMQSATLRIIGGSNAILGGGGGRLGTNAWELNQGSGTWAPENPLLISVEYRGSDEAACSFAPR